MPIPAPFPGLVICYSFLWSNEAKKGLSEGTKDRPCVIVLLKTETEGDKQIVTVAPVTHTPSNTGRALAMSPKLKRHLKLDEDDSWIALDEFNRFVWPGPDLRPISRRHPGVFSFGVLPTDVFDQLKTVINKLRLERSAVSVIPR
jgi:hypothetical protein